MSENISSNLNDKKVGSQETNASQIEGRKFLKWGYALLLVSLVFAGLFWFDIAPGPNVIPESIVVLMFLAGTLIPFILFIKAMRKKVSGSLLGLTILGLIISSIPLGISLLVLLFYIVLMFSSL